MAILHWPALEMRVAATYNRGDEVPGGLKSNSNTHHWQQAGPIIITGSKDEDGGVVISMLWTTEIFGGEIFEQFTKVKLDMYN